MRLHRLTTAVVVLAALANLASAADSSQPFSRILKEAISRADSFIVAYDGEAFLYNYDLGIVKAPFLHDVYKSFGLSYDSRYFLYLKSNGKYPTFSLYTYDLWTGEDRRLITGSVHYAAWSPVSHEFASISLDAAGRFQVAVRDLDSGKGRQIFSGMAQPDFLEWSPAGDELLFVSVEPLTRNYIHDQRFNYTLHTFSTRRNADATTPGVRWARFDGANLVALGKQGAKVPRALPNPDGEDVRDFIVLRGQVYATILDAGELVVKELDSSSNAWRFVAAGHLYTATEKGIVIREFHQGGVSYSYVAAGTSKPLAGGSGRLASQSLTASAQAVQTSTFSGNWKMPFQGSAFLVQGGALYGNGSCDGAPCMITSHRNMLGYALDWQQVAEQGQGNWHLLAVEDGTVVATENSVNCNTGTPACVDYSTSCNDPSGGLGNYVSIAHPDGSYSFYGHMKFGSVQVVPNQAVTQGTYIGDQGHSGVAATYNNYHNCGDHVHFQRQTGPAPWTQSIPTDFSELPCGLTCTSSYLSANIENTWPAVGALTVTLSPGTIVGNGTSVGNRVILDTPAPTGGAVVTLASSNPSLAVVPSSVTVPDGSTSATFPIQVNAAGSTTPVAISAAFGTANASATLTITPVSLSRMNLSQFTVNGGSTVGGNELDLTASAPTPFPITLTSSAPSVASVPSSATVAAGSNATLFSIATSSVATQTNVTITATDGVATRSAVLQVKPVVQGPPTLSSISPSSAAAGTALPVTLTGTNFISGATVNVSGTGVSVSGVSVTSTTQITATLTIASGASLGGYGVTVTTSAGTSAPVTFTVAAPAPPTLTTISPATGVAGTSVGVTLAGTNFLSGATISVGSPDVTVSNITVTGTTQMTATFAIASAAALGTFNVAVTTAAGTSNPVPFTLTAFTPIRVNAGGPAYTDALGQLWSADSGFTISGGTATFAGPVYGSSAPVLYQTARWGNPPGNPALTYQTSVPNGTYTVNMKFVDGAFSVAGKRKFTIVVNGVTVASNFDIVAQSGSISQAVDMVAPVNVTNGQITIQLVPVLSNPKICAIEILAGNVPVPALASISPSAIAPGNTAPVTITGTNFISDVAVNAGQGTSLSNVTVTSPTQITANLTVASTAAAGTNTVRVTAAGGTSPGIPLQISSGPSLTSISPTSGSPGTSVNVTLTGANFTSGATVNTTSPDIAVTNVAVASATQITATFAIAAGATPGNFNVSVTTGAGTSGTVPFSISAPPPVLSAISPSSGSPGASVPVTLTGSNFTAGATVAVSGTGVAASAVTVASPTQITATLTIASGAASGARAVTVTTSGGTSSSVSFTVNAAAPTLASISPASGVAGTGVSTTLAGTNFLSGATVAVSSPDVSVTNIVVVSSTQITANFTLAANAAPGTFNVTVTTTSGTSNAVSFTVNAAVPTLASISPASGVAGTGVSVTLAGTNFLSGATVAVSSPDVSVTNTVVVSSTQITANFTLAANAAPGTFNVTVTTTSGTSNAVAFTVNPPAPTLTSVSPNSGTAGTNVPVTLTGANFVVGASVSVGNPGIAVSGVVVVSAAQITANFAIAPGAAPVPSNVVVTTSGGSSGPVPFTVVAPAPVVNTISPTSGNVGTAVAVTISGSGFSAGSTVSTTSPDITVSNVNVANAAQITATFTIAASATSGTYNVSVTTSSGTSNAGTFTVTALSAIRVNAGGPAYTDPLGQTWAADSGFNSAGGTTTTTNPVLGTAVPALYQSARWGNPSPPYTTYQAAVPNGTYTVNMKFVDAVSIAPGQRIFKVLVNGQTAVANFDMIAQTGATNQAVDVPIAVNVTNGQITIQIVPVTGNPKICAIEIIPGTVAAPAITALSTTSTPAGVSFPITITGTNFTSDVVVNAGPGVIVSNVNLVSATQITATFTIPAGVPPGPANVRVTTPGGTTAPSALNITWDGASPLRVNGGGVGYTDALGQYWSSDTGFNNAGGAATTTNTITGTSAPALYQTAHWGNPPNQAQQFAYTFPSIPDGAYVINLKFVDGAFSAVGKRVFNVSINGQQALSNFDIFANSGSMNQAIDVPLPVNITGGSIVIQFAAVVSNPKINAIEIVPAAAAPAPAISAISPASASAGTTTPVTITGSGFTSDVVINAGPRITVTNVAVASATQITANFAVASGTAPGTVNVNVTAPGGTATAPFTTQ